MRIVKLTPAVESRLLESRAAQDRTAHRVAEKIVADVKRRGDAALDRWSRTLDDLDPREQGVWVLRKEMAAARKRVSPDLLRAVAHATRNVRRVAEQQLARPWSLRVEPGVEIRQILRPIDSIGCYIPGGRFALFSTLIMTVVPAQVAGVGRIVAVCPKPNLELLAAADFLGVQHLARIGGTQAIAALAYGTKRIGRVEKIFGPGNRFVTAAKQIVSTDCAIDLPAGPTEAVVLARHGNARWIAADLLAQAEHAPDAGSYLVTPSTHLAKAVQTEAVAQLNSLPASNPAHRSLRETGAILLAKNWDAAIAFVNRIAPEHLSLPQSSRSLLERIRSAGTIFIGSLSAQPFGDYASGSNHVLPTGGWARRRGGLSVSDFMKTISVQRINRTGYLRLARDVQTMTRAEGLLAHANAIEVRQ
jgi:histidinol dehydrogenase